MPLDPRLQMYQQIFASLRNMTPQEARALTSTGAMAQSHSAVEEVSKVEDRKILVDGSEITVRIYTPDGEGPFPVLVYYHGGGFILGDLETVDLPCRQIANRAQCIVVSVDYRLAPEHKFPIPVEDGYAALRWAAEHATTFNGDPARIAVAGDSAGGNIATVASLMAKERGGPNLCFQVLLYPPVDFVTERPVLSDMPGNLLDTFEYFSSMYFRTKDDAHNAYASPILAKNLKGLPNALIITAEFDPLNEEGERYANKLRAAGVNVEYRCYEGLTHGFINMVGMLDKAKESVEQISLALRTAFGVFPD